MLPSPCILVEHRVKSFLCIKAPAKETINLKKKKKDNLLNGKRSLLMIYPIRG